VSSEWLQHLRLQAAWVVLSSSTFATHNAAAGGGAVAPRGLLAEIQARSE
jgi:hypothetical protein